MLRIEQLRRIRKRLCLQHVQLFLHPDEHGHWAGLHSRQVDLLLREPVAGVLRGLGPQLYQQLLYIVVRLPWRLLLARGHHIVHLALYTAAISSAYCTAISSAYCTAISSAYCSAVRAAYC